ncbi:hypothetical protein TNCV_886571 [Trichonephila clavipes]|uniref:Uncharacterized protein n=1 Tax=Trichonephila clavipes TaxID=2585209 RepID=A0A8X6RCA2_TRICX|nr:hypothetical protein TNCV_886571 [Trichonephila clavipes]
MNSWSKRLPKEKDPLSKPYGLSMPSQTVFFGVQGVETLWCAKPDPLDSFGSNSVGRMFWAGMVRLCLPSARHVFYLSQPDTLAGKDAMWSFISLALPPAIPGYDWSHVPPLQNTQHPAAPLDTVLSPRKMGE